MDKPLQPLDMRTVIDSSRLMQAIDHMGIGVAITDPNLKDNPLVYVNQGFTKVTGYTPEEVLLRSIRFLQGEDTAPEHLNVIKKSIKDQKAETVTIKNYRKDGQFFWNQLIISPIFDTDGHLEYYIGLQFDVTEEVEKREAADYQLALLSNFDPVTGLLSISSFKKELDTEIGLGENFAVLRINVNRFRYINESYGEDVGDKLLVAISERLKHHFGPETAISRSFSDDFIVLLIGDKGRPGPEEASSFLEMLRMPYYIDEETIRIDISLGISMYPDHGMTGTLLLKHAEVAMKQGKVDYSGQPCFFNYSLLERLQKRMDIEKKMPAALENGEFELYFQPKTLASTKELKGVEALIRWNDPECGLISPMQFIPIAEENGFIIQLGRWVLEEACFRSKSWQDMGYPPIPVSVNVSAVQFKHPQFIEMVERALEKTGLDPSLLELEVTETIFNDPRTIKEKLDKLKQHGISISLDDFGTGYSSINYLKNLPIDVLKIDKAFIEKTPESEQDNHLLRSIIQLGKSFGLTVLVEGVETQEQFDFLGGNGCDLVQGYYFSRPLDLNGMEKLLERLYA